MEDNTEHTVQTEGDMEGNSEHTGKADRQDPRQNGDLNIVINMDDDKYDAELTEISVDSATDTSPPVNSKETKSDEQKDHYENVTEIDGNLNWFSKLYDDISNAMQRWFSKQKQNIFRGTQLILLLLYLAYVAYSLYVEFGDEGSWRLLVCTVLGLLGISWINVRTTQMGKSGLKLISAMTLNVRSKTILRWFLYLGMTAFIVVYLTLIVIRGNARNLVSLSGIVTFIILLLMTRKNKTKIQWHTIFWGFSLQFILAVFVLKTHVGAAVVRWISSRLIEYMKHAAAGSLFVFGPRYTDFPIIFVALPQVIFFFATLAVLVHLGVLQFINKHLGAFLAYVTGSSPVESLSATANMFLGGAEVTLLIQEYLHDVSESEIFTLYINNMASIGGAAMVTFIGFGIPAPILIAASVMSAPAALAAAKLNWSGEPGSTKKRTKLNRKTKSALEAFSKGASQGLTVVGNIAINLMTFLSAITFLNATVTWLGDRAGVDGLTLEVILSYLLWPLSFIMGVDTEDCQRVSVLLGVRTLTNTGVAYTRLAVFFKNKETYRDYTSMFNDSTIYSSGDIYLPQSNTSLIGGILTDRSEMIASYALCGFACIPIIGVSLASFMVLAPHLVLTMTKMSFRVVIVATLASYFTACIAGLLFEGEI